MGTILYSGMTELDSNVNIFVGLDGDVVELTWLATTAGEQDRATGTESRKRLFVIDARIRDGRDTANRREVRRTYQDFGSLAHDTESGVKLMWVIVRLGSRHRRQIVGWSCWKSLWRVSWSVIYSPHVGAVGT